MAFGKYAPGLGVLLALAAGGALTNACVGASSSPSPPGFSAGSSCSPNGGCGGSGGGFAGGPQPSFGTTTIASGRPPPPISGGTLLVLNDGNTVVASDADRDALYIVDLAGGSLISTIALQPGDEPGRLVEDHAGRVHAALRGGGALVTIDPRAGTVLSRRPVCPAPRGVAWEASSDLVWVACATGELVALPSAGGQAARSYYVERDLRDVIVQADGSLTVTKFRSAEVLRLASDGSISRRDGLVGASGGLPVLAAQVAWRTVAGPQPSSTVVVHQLESTQPISTSTPGGYGGGSGPIQIVDPGVRDGGGPAAPPPRPPGVSIVESAVTTLNGDGTRASTQIIPEAVLPVDVAVSSDGRYAIAAAGAGFTSLPSVWLLEHGGARSAVISNVQVVAVAFDSRGDLLAQVRQPAAALWIVPAAGGSPQAVPLSDSPRADTGHDIFHTQAGAFVACASCHPEGGDDGHVWMLEGLPRRTPSLRGTIAGTAPYHWPGDEATMQVLVHDVYTGRMGGALLDSTQEQALASWVESIPAPPAPSGIDPTAARRGQTLFAGVAACSTCHSGPKLTNNTTVDVGTGTDSGREPDGGPPPTAFQVPPLVGVGWRTPLLHDGCALTIADRFGRCATPKHGSTANLSAQDVSDLTAYLETL